MRDSMLTIIEALVMLSSQGFRGRNARLAKYPA